MAVVRLSPRRLTAFRTLAALLACLVVITAVPPAQAGADHGRGQPHAKKPWCPKPPSHGGSRNVLPPFARPHGYSLDRMASAVANLSASGNDPAYYPDTPFQIIYRTGDNTFMVKPGTFLYVKFFFVDDSPPVIGDFPENKWEAIDYIFGPTQLGGHDLEIEVDGDVASLDRPGYIGGPVATPDSPDGSDNPIQIGAFVSPLKKGTHTITIRGAFEGDALVALFGGPFEFEATYTVIVK